MFGPLNQPTGRLTLDQNGNVLPQNQLAGSSAGSYTLQASYLGDINFAPTSVTTNVVVSAQQSTPIMHSSINPTTISQWRFRRHFGQYWGRGNRRGCVTGRRKPLYDHAA